MDPSTFLIESSYKKLFWVQGFFSETHQLSKNIHRFDQTLISSFAKTLKSSVNFKVAIFCKLDRFIT